jgi:hypothetical protein
MDFNFLIMDSPCNVAGDSIVFYPCELDYV